MHKNKGKGKNKKPKEKFRRRKDYPRTKKSKYRLLKSDDRITDSLLKKT